MERFMIIMGFLTMCIAGYTIFLMRKIQRRNERYLYYQYKLNELDYRIKKTPDLLKERDSNFLEILQILKNNHKEYIRIYEKMKKEFGLIEI